MNSPLRPPAVSRNAICLCTDRRMLIPALFVASSILSMRRDPGAHPFDLVIFAEKSEVDDVHRNWMEQRGIQLCDDLDMTRLRGVTKFQERLSEATLVKLVIAEHLAGRYDKLLYLDADLTIHDDVSRIFALDTGEHPLAAVPSGRPWAYNTPADQKRSEDSFRALGMTEPFRFFNSGVMFIDVEKWNLADLTGRALAFIRQNADLCVLPDEHGLNGVLNGHLSQLSPAWNAPPVMDWRQTGPRMVQPVIVHHAGEDKPWRRFGKRKRLFPDLSAYKMYQAFLAHTPWPNWLSEQWEAGDVWRSCKWELRELSRKLNVKSDETTRAQRLSYMDARKTFYETEPFADVEQGIVVRRNGVLQLDDGRFETA